MQEMKEQIAGNILEPFFEGIMYSIIADMKGRKLLQSYSTIGLDASMYETDLDKVVFLLVGIKIENQTDDLKDWYYQQIDQIQNVEIYDDEKISKMASDVLLGLMERKTNKK